ncbi:MAG: Si-specific NAD(P)(+) transhydrogenase [Myxococcales bacterium]|nr:Si-specific NAD(P)(+) transhydrogenase [Myxococcales bacterium]
MQDRAHYDLLVIGSGPGGQKAAIQGGKAGARVGVIERRRDVGGYCVHSATIPSKTLRETTLALDVFRARSGGLFDLELAEGTRVASLLDRLERVTSGHVGFISEQLQRNGINVIGGQARFVSPHEVEVVTIEGTKKVYTADNIIIATGSRPRCPDNFAIDHEHVVDSDSVLSLAYLPRSMVVLGAGVIGSEYASIFSALGVEVMLVDRRDRPVAFLDKDLTDGFQRAFTRRGGAYIPGVVPTKVDFDGVEARVVLDNGEEIHAEKVLCSLGRVPNLERLQLQNAGLSANSRGILEVDSSLRSAVSHIYGVGDVIGPPSLASWAMEQGRRAARNALGLSTTSHVGCSPAGIYTIPEMAMVGQTEEQVREEYSAAMVGMAHYAELSRGHIAGVTDGLLKLITDPKGERILGVHILGEGATELIHVGQMAMLMEASPDVFVENTFNFPTFAEGYRVAALDIVGQMAKARRSAA